MSPTRKAARQESNSVLARENRALRALSACNEALISIRDESELLADVCRIIVEEAEYKLAWFGLVRHDEERTVLPVAACGCEDGYLEKMGITWADTERGRGPTGTAIRTGEPCVAQSILTDPSFKPWRAEAVKRGYASSVAIPVHVSDEPYGALNVYAPEPYAFDEDELTLLSRLARNLSYGLETIQTRLDHVYIEKRLRRMRSRSLLYVDLMSHDIANHLQSIILSTEIVRTDPNFVDVSDLLETILVSSDACRSIISKVRDLSRLMEVHLEERPLDNLLQECVASFSAIHRDSSIKTDCKVEDALVWADEFAEAALLNIMENAVRHNPTEDKHVWIQLEESHGGYEVTIADDGPGISDARKTELLDPARRYGGLGLHQTRQVLEKYGGRIDVHDRVIGHPDQGTRVRLWFPRSDNAY
ncbi:MAG: GAF domain-containing protein [Candidatus Thorarchaeota archaeon]